MRTRTAILILIALMAIAALGYRYLGAPREAELVSPPSGLADAMDIVKPLEERPLVVTEAIKNTDAKGRYAVNVEYPSIVLATDPRTAQLASDVIKGEVNRMVDDFLVNARDVSNAPNIPPEFTSDLTVRYDAELLTPSLIAIRFDRSEYIRGAAHPDTQVRIVQYDTREHALLSTADLFASGSDHLGFLSDYCREKLRTILTVTDLGEEGDFIVPGTEPTVENFRNVLVTREGMTVFFNPAQVAPYARGLVSVDIPTSDLSSRISGIVRTAIEESNASTTVGVSEPSILMNDE